MEEKKTCKNLDEKLMELKKEVSILQKEKEGHGYKYVTEDQILLKINDKMIELGIKLTPRFKAGTLHSEVVNYQNAKGQQKTDILVTSEMQYVWKDIETGETDVVDWSMVGQQSDGSQALGSGLTYANRYFLLKYFNVATSEDDPDKIRSEIAKEDERKKLSTLQTKIKKKYSELLQIVQTKDKLYETLGTDKETFKNNYNTPALWEQMLEQLELTIKNLKG